MGGPGSGRKKGSGKVKRKDNSKELLATLKGAYGKKAEFKDFGKAGRIAIANMKKK